MKGDEVGIYVRVWVLVMVLVHQVFLTNELDASQIASMTVVQTNLQPASEIANHLMSAVMHEGSPTSLCQLSCQYIFVTAMQALARYAQTLIFLNMSSRGLLSCKHATLERSLSQQATLVHGGCQMWVWNTIALQLSDHLALLYTMVSHGGKPGLTSEDICVQKGGLG